MSQSIEAPEYDVGDMQMPICLVEHIVVLRVLLIMKPADLCSQWLLVGTPW